MTVITFEKIVSKLQNDRVLLVGGAGFIGHNLAVGLGQAGVPVMVLDNLMVNSLVDNSFYDDGNLTKRELNLHFLMSRFEIMRSIGIEFRNCDARNFSDIANVFNEFKPTRVVHLAAIASAVEARKDPGKCFDLQLSTLRNVLELCRLDQKDMKTLMFLSSSTVYGDFEGAIRSMDRRGYLTANATKMRFGMDLPEISLKRLIETQPRDPMGIIEFLDSFKNAKEKGIDNIEFLCYPYSNQDAVTKLQNLGFKIDFEGFSLRERKKKFGIVSRDVKEILSAYKDTVFT